MKHFIGLLVFTLAISTYSFAQKIDSLYVLHSNQGWVIRHKIKPKETIIKIARAYHVPPAILAANNGVTIQTALTPQASLWIPIAAYNLMSEGGMVTSEMRPIYHKLKADESLKTIAKNSNTQQKKLLEWNKISTTNLYEGQVLLVGWILYDATGSLAEESPIPIKEKKPISSNNSTPIAQPKPIRAQETPVTTSEKKTDSVYYISTSPKVNTTSDTDSVAPKTAWELLYETQTGNEASVAHEKGPCVFFRSNKSGTTSYYAFHNTAPKGTIIKVRNPGNGKVVYVKVLGTIPTTGMYHKAVIGIASSARAALGAMGDKVWCELSY